MTGGLTKMHETAVVSATFPDGGARHWVTVFNNCADPATCSAYTVAGWVFSSDLTASHWVPAMVIDGGLGFGDPGPTADNSTVGWMGDPGLVAVTSPDDSNGGVRVLYTNIGQSHARGNSPGGSDIVVAVSDNGGQTFSNAKYVDLPGAPGSQWNTTQAGTDFPQIAADPQSPYGIWVSWVVGNQGYINWIRYDQGLAYTNGVPKAIPDPLTATNAPVITVGSIASCSGLHEAVYVAWPTDGERDPQACQNGAQSTSNVVWEWAAYDTVMDAWWGPWQFDQDPQFVKCIGSPIIFNSTQPSANDSIASIASLGVNVVLVNPHSSPFGQKIHERGVVLACVDGGMEPQWGPLSVTPIGCYIPGSNCPGTDAGAGNSTDGGIIPNDDWGAKVVYTLKPPSTPVMLITYYGTRFDPQNNLVRIWGGTATNPFDNPFASVFAVANAVGAQAVPWDHTLAPWWDYLGIGVEPQGTFFTAWGGDARLGASRAGVWGARLQ